MSRERGFDKILSAYRDASKQPSDTLILVGDPERSIYEEFKDIAGITFTGRLPQKDALAIVKKSEYAICYFPYHRPHCFQTPTKLLEYIALHKNIVCNDSPSNIYTCKDLNIKTIFTDKLIFNDKFFLYNDCHNIEFIGKDIQAISWTSVIKGSRISEYIGNQ